MSRKSLFVTLLLVVIFGLILIALSSQSRVSKKTFYLTLDEPVEIDEKTFIVFVKHTPNCLEEEKSCYSIGIFDLYAQEPSGVINSFNPEGQFQLKMEETKVINNFYITFDKITNGNTAIISLEIR